MMNSKNKNRKVHTWIKESGDQQSEDIYRSARGVRDATWAMTKGGKQNIIAITPLKTISQRRKAQKKWPRENKRKTNVKPLCPHFLRFFNKMSAHFLIAFIINQRNNNCRVRLNNQIEKCHRNFLVYLPFVAVETGRFSPKRTAPGRWSTWTAWEKFLVYFIFFFLFLLLGICNKILKNGKRKIWKPEG